MLVLDIKASNNLKIDLKEDFIDKAVYTGVEVGLGNGIYSIPKINMSVTYFSEKNVIAGYIVKSRNKISLEYIDVKSKTLKEQTIESDDERNYIDKIKFIILLNMNHIAIERKSGIDNNKAVTFFNQLFERQYKGQLYVSYRLETPFEELSNCLSKVFSYKLNKPNPIHPNSPIDIKEIFKGTNSEKISGKFASSKEENLNLSGVDLIESIIELASAGYGNTEMVYEDAEGNIKKYNQKKDALLLVSPPLPIDDNDALIDWLEESLNQITP